MNSINVKNKDINLLGWTKILQKRGDRITVSWPLSILRYCKELHRKISKSEDLSNDECFVPTSETSKYITL
jgi:hypothetical protein